MQLICEVTDIIGSPHFLFQNQSEVMFLFLFCFAVVCILSSFAIMLLGKRKLVALFLLCSECHVI